METERRVNKKTMCVAALVLLALLAAAWFAPPDTVSAEDEGVLSYEVSNGNATITSCRTDATNKDVEDAFTSIGAIHTITAIAGNAFQNCAALTSVDIPEGVTSIGNSAFRGCSLLNAVTLPSSLETLGSSPFQGTAISSISIPASVTGFVSGGTGSLGNMPSLTTVTFEGTRTSFPANALYGADTVTTVNMPEGVTGIGASAFYNCSNLEYVNFPGQSATAGHLVFPEGVTSIGNSAFRGCSLLNAVTLPSSLETLGSSPFQGTAISSISIPASVTGFVSGGTGSLGNMPSLTTVTFESGRENIPRSALYSASTVTKILVPKSVTTIEGNAFADCTGVTVYGYYDTYAIEYAESASLPNMVLPTFLTTEIDPVYQYIPYLFMFETNIPGNSGLTFSVSDGALPAGLSLNASTGEISGAPLNNQSATFTISVTDAAGLWPDEVTFTLTPLPPTDALLVEINDYEIITPIEQYITGYKEDVTNQIFKTDGEYPLFFGFWINGIEQTRNDDYTAEAGSTVVTIMAKTIQDLDNGPYTAAAAFRDGDEETLTVVAQNFRVNTVPRPADGEDQGGDPNVPGGDPNTPDGNPNVPGGDPNTPDGNPNVPGGDPDTPDGNPNVPGGDPNTPDGNPNVPGGDPNTPGGNPNVPGGNPNTPDGSTSPGDNPGENPVTPDGNTDPNAPDTPGNPNTPGNNTDAPDGAENGNTPVPETPGDTPVPPGDTDSGDNDGNANTPGASGTPGGNTVGAASGGDTNAGAGGSGSTGTNTGAQPAANNAAVPTPPPSVVSLIDEAGTAAAPAGTVGEPNAANAEAGASTTDGGGTPGGLAREADGSLTYTLGADGAPFELRIDLPFSEFRSLAFDGAPWERGTDYAVREGSTILTITAERLSAFDAGVHTVSAVFENETVEIEFLLQKPAGIAAGGEAALPGEAMADPSAAKPGLPVLAIAAIALVLLVLLAACTVAIIRYRSRRAA